DAFRGDVHAEPAPEAHDGMDDGRGIGGILEIGDEAAIDFQAVEREGAQIEQARISGAEVVEYQPHAERAQPMHRTRSVLDVAEEGALGELELEKFPRECARRSPRNPAGEIATAKR